MGTISAGQCRPDAIQQVVQVGVGLPFEADEIRMRAAYRDAMDVAKVDAIIMPAASYPAEAQWRPS